MIRKLQKTDIDRIIEIWLDCNLKAHEFIPERYWRENADAVKEMLPQAEVYVYEEENLGEMQGFIGMNGEYIEGIFVWNENQSKGIGKKLLDYVKRIKKKIYLSVYQKNQRALDFYQRENFKIQCENIDENTGEKEYYCNYNAKREDDKNYAS